MDTTEAKALVGDDLLVKFNAERTKLDMLDRWWRWEHDEPHTPKKTPSAEYRELMGRAQTPWLGLVVTGVAQALYVEGYRAAGSSDNATPWEWWQRNGMDRRQIPIHRTALAYGISYATVLPGKDTLGSAMPVIRGVSPRNMMAFYRDPAEDDWPEYAIKVTAGPKDTKKIRLFTATEAIDLEETAEGGLSVVATFEHGVGVCPVVRYCNQLDLEGRTPGEVEPYIPVAARADQTVFDRLVVQRFSSFRVRTIAGLTLPDNASAVDREKMRLSVEDILVAEDHDTKFGSLAPTELKGFVEAREADLRDLAAVAQVPPNHLLGQMANLSAEALAAAEASLSRKVEERKHSFGQSHEQTLRLAGRVSGDTALAADWSAQVRWRDMESRSLAQAADALGKLATMLKVPVEMLWEKVPGWTDQDVERAKALVEQGGALDSLIRELEDGLTVPEDEPVGVN